MRLDWPCCLLACFECASQWHTWLPQHKALDERAHWSPLVPGTEEWPLWLWKGAGQQREGTGQWGRRVGAAKQDREQASQAGVCAVTRMTCPLLRELWGVAGPVPLYSPYGGGVGGWLGLPVYSVYGWGWVGYCGSVVACNARMVMSGGLQTQCLFAAQDF